MLIELIIERLSVAVTVTAGDWSETLVSMEGGLIEMIPVNSGATVSSGPTWSIPAVNPAASSWLWL